MTPDRRETLNQIKSVLGPKGWLDEPADVAPYLVEQRGLFHGATQLVARPRTVEEVAAIVAICAQSHLPIVPQSGNTGLVGGAAPPSDGDNILLSLARLDRIRAIDPLNYTITAEAGVILADLQAAAEAADRFFPLSLAAEGSCRIGGNLATNAGGIAVLRYGNARDLVLGVEIVLPDGRVWNGLRALRKDNTGYDLKNLFIGSEGTLGIITAATLKLFPRPLDRETAFLGIDRIEDVAEVFSRARAASGDQLIAFELIARRALAFAINHIPGVTDPLATAHANYVLLDLATSQPGSHLRKTLEGFLGEAMAAGLVADGTIAQSAAQARDLWRIREAIVAAQAAEGGSIKNDVSVPVMRVAEFIRKASAAVEERLPGIRVVAFGHFGDGNIHFNLTQPEGADERAYLARWHELNAVVNEVAVALGGSISAEHGIGRLKLRDLEHYKSPVELDLMRRIKQALDPDGIMNPGVILD